MRLMVYTMVYCLLMTICDLAVSWLISNTHGLASATHMVSERFMPVGTSSFGSLELFRELIRLSVFLCEIAIVYVLLRNVEDGVSLREIDGGRRS